MSVAIGSVVAVVMCLPAGDVAANEDPTSSTAPRLRPPPLASHVMAYDDQLGQVVLFGGSRPDRSLTNALWAWDGSRWTLLSRQGPEPRIDAAMAYDSRRHRLVVHGGIRNRDESFDDTWEWDGTSWELVHRGDDGPGVRDHHAMVFDAARGVCVLFGGQNQDDVYPSDTWTWDGRSWKQVATSGPPVRGTHRMVFDEAHEVVVLATGWGPDGLLGDTWEWDGHRWLQPGNPQDHRDVVPLKEFRDLRAQDPHLKERFVRGASRMAYDIARKQVVLFGGLTKRAYLGDTWVRDERRRWELVRMSGPTARNVHGMACDTKRQRVVLVGGIGDEGRLDDVWEWDGDTWICVLPTTASIDAQVATLIEEARRAGDAQGDIATCVCKLQQAAAMKPADGDVQIELATALWTLGDMDAARQAVDRALQSNPHSGRAHFVMAQVQLLEGDRDAARSTVLQALEDDVLETPDQRIALSLTLVSILMRAGAFAEAARFLEKQRPELGLLDELPGPRNVEDSMDSSDPGWQVVGAYAHVLAELGQRERAQTLLRRLAPINESSLRRLRGGGLSALDHWTLAAAGAGRIPDDMALVHLEQAFDAGLLLTWRYRFGQHPCLWPLWKTRDFGNLLQRMDAEMARQRQR